ncbi:replication-relaxation family protein [Streptomyces nigra]|uniref:replication-relaxation family protein n=1 Tax=Streptomyces nigra TaxID=1827580 RepID=UPI003451B52D
MVRPSSIPLARVVRLRAKLSPRDIGVLASLHRVRLLSLKQIQRLIVVDGSPRARTRRAQLMMTRLTELGVVTRFSRIVGGVRAGSSGYIYSLSGLGQAVLNTGGPLGGRRRVWESKPYFQDHMLVVAELYVQLVERHRQGQGDLLAYDAEPANWRHFTGPGGELVQIKPDAYARIGRAAIEHSSFIEVDMSTETLPTIQKKSQRYIDYWRSGMEQQWRGVFPKVVWLVQSQQRAQKIRGVIGRLALDAQALFTVGLLTDGPRLLGGGQPEQTGAAA